jgi:hypothetical protein
MNDKIMDMSSCFVSQKSSYFCLFLNAHCRVFASFLPEILSFSILQYFCNVAEEPITTPKLLFRCFGSATGSPLHHTVVS